MCDEKRERASLKRESEYEVEINPSKYDFPRRFEFVHSECGGVL